MEKTDQVKAHLAQAIQSVVGVTSDSVGTNCVMYAMVGALAMQKLGFTKAKAVAGSALWRVGPGDGDVISHALSTMQPGMGLYSPGVAVKRFMGHAWIECGDELIDFTTHTLKQKAKMLDAADGGTTLVAWAPTFLWARKNSCLPLGDVSQSYDVGVYGYARDPGVEPVVLRWDGSGTSADEAAAQVLLTYNLLQAGHVVHVLGVDAESQTVYSAEDLEKKALQQGLVRSEGT